MKRKLLTLLALMLTLIFSISLVSCGGSDGDGDKNGSSSSTDANQVDKSTWNKYLSAENVKSFNLTYEYNWGEMDANHNSNEDHYTYNYFYNDGYYEYSSDKHGSDSGSHYPSSILDLPFESADPLIEANPSLFNYENYKYSKTSKSYTYETELEISAGFVILYDAEIIVKFENNQLSQIAINLYHEDDQLTISIGVCYSFSNFEFSKSGSSNNDDKSNTSSKDEIVTTVTEEVWDSSFPKDESYKIFQLELNYTLAQQYGDTYSRKYTFTYQNATCTATDLKTNETKIDYFEPASQFNMNFYTIIGSLLDSEELSFDFQKFSYDGNTKSYNYHKSIEQDNDGFFNEVTISVFFENNKLKKVVLTTNEIDEFGALTETFDFSCIIYRYEISVDLGEHF